MASKQPSALIHVPARFSVVEPGVFRCASPTAAQVIILLPRKPTADVQIHFLSTLGLRTIVSLTVEHPIRPLLAYARAAGVRFVHLGATLFQPLNDWRPISDEVVKAALEIVLDVRSHPVLIIDSCVVRNLRGSADGQHGYTPDGHCCRVPALDAALELCEQHGRVPRPLGADEAPLQGRGVHRGGSLRCLPEAYVC